jgi:uncharacterized protein
MAVFLAHCSAAFSGHGNVLFAFFLGGLAGSVTHCFSMCGPVVACQAACGGVCSKGGNLSQWHYHAGRLMTYGLLGFMVSVAIRPLVAYPFWHLVSSAMMAAAGMLFLLSGLFPSWHASWGITTKHSFLRGSLMGFMPCGLLYAAFMMAATITNPFLSMIAMWCFALGTMPALLLASGGAALAARRWLGAVRRIGRVGLTCNGLMLLAMATKLAR